jgi:hypothetical protein
MEASQRCTKSETNLQHMAALALLKPISTVKDNYVYALADFSRFAHALRDGNAYKANLP